MVGQPTGAIFHRMSHRSASKARTALLVEPLLVVGAVPGDVALLAAIETICKGILLFLAVHVGVVLRAAFVTKTSLCCRALAEQMLTRTAFEASLLVSLPIFQLRHRLLLLPQFLLYAFVLFLLYPLSLLFGVDHPILGIVQCLLELCKLRVYSPSFGFVLLHLLLALLDLQSRDLLLYLLQSQMDFLHHSLNYNIYRIHSIPLSITVTII